MFVVSYVRNQEWLSRGKVIHVIPLTKELNYSTREEAEEQEFFMRNAVQWNTWFQGTLFRISPPVSIEIKELSFA